MGLKALEEKEKKEREAAMKLLQAERAEQEKIAQTEAREARLRAEAEEERRLLDEMEAEAEEQGVRDLGSTRVGGADPYGQNRAKVLLALGLKIKGVAMPMGGGQKATLMAD